MLTPSGLTATRKTVDIGVPIVLSVRCSVPSEMLLADDLSHEDIAKMVAPEMLDVMMRARELLGEFVISAGALGLTLTGTVTIGGQTETIGE